MLAKVSEGLEEECRPGAQGGFLEHHGGCYQLDFIGQHIAATQGSEAAAITAIASQPKKLKKKTMKHLKCDWGGGEIPNSFSYPGASSRELKVV